MKMLKGVLIAAGLLAGGPALAHADVYGTAEVRIVYDTDGDYAYRGYTAYPDHDRWPRHRHRHHHHRHASHHGQAYGHHPHRHYRGCGHGYPRDPDHSHYDYH